MATLIGGNTDKANISVTASDLFSKDFPDLDSLFGTKPKEDNKGNKVYSSGTFQIMVTTEKSGTMKKGVENGVISDDSTADNSKLIGNDLDNTLMGNNQDNVLNGKGGNDRLDGDDGNDTLIGGDGNDTLIGGADDDMIFGGQGDDFIGGYIGNDTMIGGEGNDSFEISLRGDSGSDTILGFGTGDKVSGYNQTSATRESINRTDFKASDTDKGVKLEFNGGSDVLLKGVKLKDLHFDDANDAIVFAGKGKGDLTSG